MKLTPWLPLAMKILAAFLLLFGLAHLFAVLIWLIALVFAESILAGLLASGVACLSIGALILNGVEDAK